MTVLNDPGRSCTHEDAPGRYRPVLAVRDLARSGEAGRLRQNAGLSHAVMAAGLRTSRSLFTDLENGRRQPGPRLAARYLRVLQGLRNHDEVSRELAAQERQLAG